MNILVANDDSINARGIKELVKALSTEGKVYVAAPHIQRSATGHGITIGKPIVVNNVEFHGATEAVEVTGMPADCVKIGLKYYEEKGVHIDAVYSGINHGGNLGTDTLYSGTVSAAIEGSLCGKPAVALSVNSHEAEHFELACELAIKTLHEIKRDVKRIITLNINTPNLPKGKIKGVKYTRLGVREYEEWFKPKENHKGELEYFYHGSPVIYNSENTNIDVIADQEDYASITPIKCDLTNYDLIEEVKGWRVEK